MENNSIYVISGISGTGKSCMVEDARSLGFKVLRSFNKFLLNVRFGYGQPSYKFLTMSTFMQAFHAVDSDLGEEVPWMVERSILDPYYFTINKYGYQQSPSEVDDMNNIINLYFSLLTKGFSKKLVFIDIWNLDNDWILKSLSEESTRSNVWSSINEYLRDQESYKRWITSKLSELGIPHEVIQFKIDDVHTQFTPDMRREFIKSIRYGKK